MLTFKHICEVFMKREKKVGKPIFIATVLAIVLISITGCISMLSAMAKSMIKDYGVYDNSVPESQLVDFLFTGVSIKTFDGNNVNWGNGSDNMGRIKIPAGTHDFTYDWVHEETRQTGTSHYSGTTIIHYTTTTRSLKDITVSQMQFLPGHRYGLSGGWINGQVRIYIHDLTNMRADMYGDIIPNAPKESTTTPTVLEGRWIGTDNTSFRFNGNTWIAAMPPDTLTNYSDTTVRARGTFEINGNKVTMYQTHGANATGSWHSIGGLKIAYIWTYKINGEYLELEIEYLTPKVIYSKLQR